MCISRRILTEKKTAEEQIARLERDACAWLEPMQAWVLTASTLGEIAERNDLPSKKSSLQKIFGSNLTLHDKKVRENPSPAYATLRAAREKFASSDTSFIRAGGLGVGPRLEASKAPVLPLDDPPILQIIYITKSLI